MKERTYKIIKAITLVFAVIIPLAVAFLMCRYTYKRHFDNYGLIYFSNIKYDRKGKDKNNYQEQIEGYFKYNTYKYRLLTTKEIKYSGDKNLATLDIYEIIERTKHDDETYSYDLTYYFILHDVNYSNMWRLSEGDENATIPSSNSIPTIFLQIRDANDFDNNESCLNYEFNDEEVLDYLFIDYGATPAKLGSQTIQVFKMGSNKLPSNSITLALHCDSLKSGNKTDEPDTTKSEYIFTKDASLSIDTFYVDLDEAALASFTDGFEQDALASGYKSYLLKTYWWWEALVTIFLVGGLTTIFYLVITYRDEEKEL